MVKKLKKITILIPCHNEEHGVGKVIDSIPHQKLKHLGFKAHVIVIDNNSTDKTVAVALKRKVKVIHEHKKGKGNAMKTGFLAVPKDTSYVVMLDGDNTYKASEMHRLVEPLESEFCDVVVGSRLGGRMKHQSLRLGNRIANWGYAFLVRTMYRANITDVLSGYFAWKRSVVTKLVPHIESRGFSIEIDMITKCMRLGYSMCSVPITYDIRVGESKIQALTDGMKILFVLLINIIWHPKHKYSRRTKLVSIAKSPFAKLNQSIVDLGGLMMF